MFLENTGNLINFRKPKNCIDVEILGGECELPADHERRTGGRRSLRNRHEGYSEGELCANGPQELPAEHVRGIH